MDIQIIEHIKETLSVVIQCNKIERSYSVQ